MASKKTEFALALIKVRKLIKSGRCKYICGALSFIDRSEHKQKIMDLLDGAQSFEVWMCRHHSKLYATMKEKDFKQARLQWIDWMIARENSLPGVA